MDKRIEELIEFTREKHGLELYDLHKWELSRSLTSYHETVYTLNMEWFPHHLKGWDDDMYNPAGTGT